MTTFLFPSLVRDQVLEQHAGLRLLLEEVLAATVPPLPPGQSCHRLAARARELCRRFREHLAFEEEALRPVLAVLDSWGPERVRNLCDEHTRQRERLDVVLATFDLERRDVPQLAAGLRQLALDLLEDMEEEERGCLQASGMADGLLENQRH